MFQQPAEIFHTHYVVKERLRGLLDAELRTLKDFLISGRNLHYETCSAATLLHMNVADLQPGQIALMRGPKAWLLDTQIPVEFLGITNDVALFSMERARTVITFGCFVTSEGLLRDDEGRKVLVEPLEKGN